MKYKELNPTNRKVIYQKTKGFGKVLWELSLDNIDAKIESLKNSETSPHSNFIEGLSQIISSLDTFLDTTSMKDVSDNFYIKVFDAVHLESGEILRMSEKFQGKEWFSNVAVNPADDQGQYRSDEGAWYGKVSEH